MIIEVGKQAPRRRLLKFQESPASTYREVDEAAESSGSSPKSALLEGASYDVPSFIVPLPVSHYITREHIFL